MSINRTLVLSVGTGLGSENEGLDSLVHGLVFSIESVNPDKIVYIVSEKSRKTTLPKILEETRIEYETILLEQVDNINSIYNQLRPEIEKIRRNTKILYVDFTSGTKAMTSSLAMLGALYESDRVCNIVGTRKNGVVQQGTENFQQIEPTFAIAEKKIYTARTFFNNHQYQAAQTIIREIKEMTRDSNIINRVNVLEKTCKAYRKWDLFNHDDAYDLLKELDNPIHNLNKKFLGLMQNSENKTRYLVADLLNNASRRGIVEGKYDDAVARYYRIIELLAQHRLMTKYGLDTAKVDPRDIPEPYRTNWTANNSYDTLKLPMRRAYRLLDAKGDPLGKTLDDKELRDLLQARNNSILAHGETPVSYETYQRLKEIVHNRASETVPDLEQLLVESRYPELEKI